jgi:tyrosyl-tRNA synthetase
MTKSDFLHILTSRGYLHQCTDLEALDRLLCGEIVTGYVGFDATASSLHVGNLLSIMVARHFQKAGHRPLILVGGGTTRVGDPSGKDGMRRVLSEGEIQKNIEGISTVFSKFLTFGPGEKDATLVNNADWLDQLNYVDFLGRYGRHFSVNRMLTFDSVRLRLEREQPLTFLEFNYMILQAYDFLELKTRLGCRLQFGGSDQWGNIINGVDLIRKMGQGDAFGLTSPLLTTSTGEKMGKSAQGAIWLNPEMLAPYDYWQFWRNTQDGDVGRFLKLYTEVPLPEIGRLEALQGAEINQAKIILADEATRLLHGEAALRDIHLTASQVFGGDGEVGQEGLLPRMTLTWAQGTHGVTLVQVLCELGFATSNGEARRLIQGGGARLNNQVISDGQYLVSSKDFVKGMGKVSAGKKRHGLICWEEE